MTFFCKEEPDAKLGLLEIQCKAFLAGFDQGKLWVLEQKQRLKRQDGNTDATDIG